MGLPLPRSPPAVVRLRRCRGGLRPTRWFSDRFHSTLRVSPCGASLFARGGKGTKTPPGVSRGRLTAPAEPPPDPRLRGLSLYSSAKVPARKIRFRGFISSGPPDPDTVQNFGLFRFTAAPGSDQPWQRVQGRGCVDRNCPKTGNGRASVPPLRYEKKVLLQRNDGRGKPLPCGMGGETLCGKGLRPLLLSERKNGGPSGPPFAAPLIPRRSYSNKQAVRRASRSPLRWGRRL